MSILRKLCLAWLASACLVSTATQAQTTPAVEYRHSGWGYYFVTAAPAEIALLDGGAYGGVWRRTGESFNVWAAGAADLAETCRFFSVSFAPVSTHFYTPFASECALVKTNRDWQYEQIAYYLKLADGNGTCPAGTAVLYRLYNEGGGGAPNHRYTTSLTVVNAMHAAGWTSEGHGVTGAFACAGAGATNGSPVAGLWSGTTDAGETVRAVVLENGTYYFHIVPPGVNMDGGVVQGTLAAAAGTVTSANGRRYPIVGVPRHGTSGRVATASVSGSYVSLASMQLTVSWGTTTRAVTVTHDARSTQPASAAAIAGRYAGKTGHAQGGSSATMVVNADGTLTGANDVCTFTGTLTPRASVNAFDLALQSAACIFGQSATGALYYDPVTQEVLGFAPFDAGVDIYFMLGARQ